VVTTRQATVRSWDAADLGGSALLDDGTRVLLPPRCLQGSVFRFLRVGQRVTLTFDGETVVEVGLP
jgi:hypothetical protein